MTGALNAALYDLASGHVYSLDAPARSLVQGCEAGEPVAAASQGTGAPQSSIETVRFLEKLEALGLGEFSEKPEPARRPHLPPAPTGLQQLWLELTDRCNLRCVHCYADASPRAPAQELNVARWESVLDEAASLGAWWVQLIGGEPLLAGKERLFAVIARARALRFSVIEAFTNATLLDDACAGFFRENGVIVAISLYARRPEVHDRITRSSGSFQRTMGAIERLRQSGIPFRVGIVVMAQNARYEAETVEWAGREFGKASVSCDVARCTPGGRASPFPLLTLELWSRRLRSRPEFPRVSRESFARNVSGHPCLNGKLCIQADGQAFPCVMDRSRPLGNVVESSLEAIVSGAAARAAWGESRDRMPVCRDCEFRYACFDCRPLSTGARSALERAEEQRRGGPLCLYDPYTGVWNEPDATMNALLCHSQASGLPARSLAPESG